MLEAVYLGGNPITVRVADCVRLQELLPDCYFVFEPQSVLKEQRKEYWDTWRQGLIDEAIAGFLKIIEFDASELGYDDDALGGAKEPAIANLAMCYEEKQDYARAAEYWREYIKRNTSPHGQSSLYQLARVLALSGDAEGALDALEEVVGRGLARLVMDADPRDEAWKDIRDLERFKVLFVNEK
jgi:tetratricopeptide (TPR) repeat protein